MTATTAPRTGLRATAARAAALAAGAVALAALQLPGRPPTLCLLRAATGVPCPFCGGTTAGVELGHGHLEAALAASPLAVLGALALALVPVLRRSRFARASRRTRLLGLAVALVAAEVWQLNRFGLL